MVFQRKADLKKIKVNFELSKLLKYYSIFDVNFYLWDWFCMLWPTTHNFVCQFYFWRYLNRVENNKLNTSTLNSVLSFHFDNFKVLKSTLFLVKSIILVKFWADFSISMQISFDQLQFRSKRRNVDFYYGQLDLNRCCFTWKISSCFKLFWLHWSQSSNFLFSTFVGNTHLKSSFSQIELSYFHF